MTTELPEMDFQRFWRRLQQLGLNAYEARSYLVLIGHPRFKALELAARAHVPRQKIYEVLDSLVEKGFAQVVQEKTKLFSAVEPSLAIPGYLGRKRQILEQDLTDSGRAGGALIEDLKSLYSEGRGGRGTLDFLRIVSEPTQTAAEYRRLLSPAGGGHARRRTPPAPGRVHRGRRRSAHRRIAAHETRGLRRRARHDRTARPRDHASHLDRRGLPPRRHGRGHERPLRGTLAKRAQSVNSPRRGS